MLPPKIAFVDIETTGGSLLRDRVIEIGVVRVEDEMVIKTYQSLIDPNCYLPPEITLLTGITSSDLEKAPTFGQIKDNITELLDDCVMVAHNVRFDYSFLKQEFKRLNLDFSPKHFCTVKLSRALFPQYKHHNLDSLIERFKFECKNRHRAFDDAFVLWEFYQKIKQSFDENTLYEAINRGLKKPTVPIGVSTELLDNLPEKPGVYIFYGENDLPLYIGKSINIRNRVLNHFSSDHISSKEMKIAQQVEKIETIVTTGELGALLKESELIKKMQPLYNRMLRRKTKLVVVKKVLDDKGYAKALVETIDRISNLEEILGIFRSKKQAKEYLVNLAKEQKLCDRLMGVEMTNGACFGYRLSRCKGACIGKEMPLLYNLRYDTAFVKTRLKRWPFPYPILIKEGKVGFIVDQWCLIGQTSDEVDQFEINKDVEFDLDTYKILKRFIYKMSDISMVKELSSANLKFVI